MTRPTEGASPETQHSFAFTAVTEFHQVFRLPMTAKPTMDVGDELAKLRVDLLVEEVGEFADATKRQDLIALADALGDIVYVAYGAALTYGIDLDAVLAEIHRSNMSKLDGHGKPIFRPDGKVLKSSSYSPPDVASVLDQQGALTNVLSARARD
ncbi:MazG nucleotide pyrophosphohydrolase domain-containing protein [Amycolatopsis japonica]|uniref:MazG nucleotide pyrophosphohydrolase domain-containing protein n=1 Tax=Amycolatopsis japonica TaxID=208439 RepID=UPI00366F5FF4